METWRSFGVWGSRRRFGVCEAMLEGGRSFLSGENVWVLGQLVGLNHRLVSREFHCYGQAGCGVCGQAGDGVHGQVIGGANEK